VNEQTTVGELRDCYTIYVECRQVQGLVAS